MASLLVKSPVVQATAKRQFAAQAALSKVGDPLAKSEPLKVSRLKNGMTLASVENHSPVTTLGIIVKSGSRNETYETTGASHALRVAAGLGTKNNSAFGLTRNIQQLGASLVCTQGREHTMYTIQATRDQTDIAIEYLVDVVSNQMFKPWELGDNLIRMKVELAGLSPAATCTELLHRAAFRSGLGNSLYCPAHLVGTHKTDALKQFVTKTFTAGRAAVVGVGIPHTTLTKHADMLSLEAGPGPSSVATKYSGGEVRQEVGGNLAYVAIAGEAAGAVHVKDAVASHLLQRILGSGSHIKRGNSMGKLAQAAAGASAAPHAVSAVSHMYSDGGLLGAMIVSDAASAGKVVEGVAAAIRSANVTDEEVAAAKKKLLVDIYSIYEESANRAEDIGAQILLAGDVVPDEKIPDLLSGVTTADVQAAADKLAGAKLSLAAVGNLSTVPYLDSL